MTSAKKHITQIVQKYIKDFPQEFEDFKEGMKMVRATLKDEYGTALGVDSSSQTRALYELPETLHNLFIMELEEEEMVWLKMGGADRKQGGQWFARTFKDFCIPNRI